MPPNIRDTCICVDSSMYLADVFRNTRYASTASLLDKYVEKLKLNVYIPNTVNIEINKRVNDIINYVGGIQRDFSQYFQDQLGDKIIETRDLKIIETFFLEEQEKLSRNHTEAEIIRKIEIALVDSLTENFFSDSPIETNEFLIRAIIIFQAALDKVEEKHIFKLKNYVIFTDSINQDTYTKLESSSELQTTTRTKPNDIKILCEVEALHRATGKRCVLVTLDNKDFLQHANIINQILGIVCCEPLYLPLALNY